MNIIKLENVGFCFGVTKSIEIATNVLNNNDYPKPIYILGYLIHNKLISNKLVKLGATIINENEIDSIKQGTIITTAHGISDTLRSKINNSSLTLVDTTCAIVKKTHDIINKYLEMNYTLILLGEKNHKEVVGLTQDKNNIYIIKDLNEISTLPQSLNKENLGFVTQTTVTPSEVSVTFDMLKLRFPNIEQLSTCCDATKKRQTELASIFDNYQNSGDTIFLVIGDRLSNNTNKLLKTISEKSKNKGMLVEKADDLTNVDLSTYSTIILTSATSASVEIVNDIYNYLYKIYKED